MPTTPMCGMAAAPDVPRRVVRRAVLVLLGAAVAAGVVGNALTPVLLRDSPVALLVLHSSYAQMGLASARVEPVVFVAVAATRRWLGELLAFAAGRVLGVEILDWYARRRGRPVTAPEALNDRWWLARDAAVVALPHPVLSAGFGVAKMPVWRFVLLKLIGSVWSVTALWYLARIAGLPLAAAADFVEANAVLLTVGAVTAGSAWWMWQRRSAPSAAE